MLAFFSYCLFSLSLAIAADPSWFSGKYPVPLVELEGELEERTIEHAKIASGLKKGSRLYFLLNQYANPTNQSTITKIDRWFKTRFLKIHLPEEYLRSYLLFSNNLGYSTDEGIKTMIEFERAAVERRSNLSFHSENLIWRNDHSTVLHGAHFYINHPNISPELFFDNQVLFHSIPDRGLASLSIGFLGFPTVGLVGFNEAGLSLSVSQRESNRTCYRGLSVFVILETILNQARSVQDAVNIISSLPRAGAYTFTLTQGKDVMQVKSDCVEITSNYFTSNYAYLHLNEAELENKSSLGSPKKIFVSFINKQAWHANSALSIVMDATQKRMSFETSKGVYEYRFKDLRVPKKPQVLKISKESTPFNEDNLILRKWLNPGARKSLFDALINASHQRSIKTVELSLLTLYTLTHPEEKETLPYVLNLLEKQNTEFNIKGNLIDDKLLFFRALIEDLLKKRNLARMHYKLLRKSSPSLKNKVPSLLIEPYFYGKFTALWAQIDFDY